MNHHKIRFKQVLTFGILMGTLYANEHRQDAESFSVQSLTIDVAAQ
jgi:hypothetical protein